MSLYMSPLIRVRRGGRVEESMDRIFSSIQSLVDERAPDEPLMIIRSRVISKRASYFLSIFPGDVLYAVKCNHDPLVLDALYGGECVILTSLRFL